MLLSFIPHVQLPGPPRTTRPTFSGSTSRGAVQTHRQQVRCFSCHQPSSQGETALMRPRCWCRRRCGSSQRETHKSRRAGRYGNRNQQRVVVDPFPLQVIVFSSDNGGVPYAGALNYPFRGSKVKLTLKSFILAGNCLRRRGSLTRFSPCTSTSWGG